MVVYNNKGGGDLLSKSMLTKYCCSFVEKICPLKMSLCLPSMYVALCRKDLTFKNEPQYYSPYYNVLLLKRPRISFLKPIVIIDVKSAFLMCHEHRF